MVTEGEIDVSALYPCTKERVQTAYKKIDREVLNSWRFFLVNHDVLCEGSPSDCFWAGEGCGKAKAIGPAVKEAIKEVLQANAAGAGRRSASSVAAFTPEHNGSCGLHGPAGAAAAPGLSGASA